MRLIRWSVANRFLVLLLTFALTGWGLQVLRITPVDAIPDLSDVDLAIVCDDDTGAVSFDDLF